MDFVFLGFMAAMAVAGLVVGKLAGKKLGKAEFDERQQLARGKAYKAGFYTLLVGLLAVYLIPIFTEWQPKDTALLPFAVICVGVTVFACVAVANDAYLGIRQNPRAMLLVLGIVVVGNLTAGFSVMESVGLCRWPGGGEQHEFHHRCHGPHHTGGIGHPAAHGCPG